MRRMCLAGAVCILAACGGGGDGPVHLDRDYAPDFVGNWVGPATFTANGQSETSTVLLPITSAGENLLDLHGMCVDGEYPLVRAQIKTATTFALSRFDCPATIIGDCATVVISYRTGAASLGSGTLHFAVTGNAAGCGVSLNFSQVFDGTPQSPTIVVDEGAPPAMVDGLRKLLER